MSGLVQLTNGDILEVETVLACLETLERIGVYDGGFLNDLCLAGHQIYPATMGPQEREILALIDLDGVIQLNIQGNAVFMNPEFLTVLRSATLPFFPTLVFPILAYSPAAVMEMERRRPGYLRN